MRFMIFVMTFMVLFAFSAFAAPAPNDIVHNDFVVDSPISSTYASGNIGTQSPALTILEQLAANFDMCYAEIGNDASVALFSAVGIHLDQNGKMVAVKNSGSECVENGQLDANISNYYSSVNSEAWHGYQVYPAAELLNKDDEYDDDNPKAEIFMFKQILDSIDQQLAAASPCIDMCYGSESIDSAVVFSAVGIHNVLLDQNGKMVAMKNFGSECVDNLINTGTFEASDVQGKSAADIGGFA